MLAWVDIETTGLDQATDQILEAGLAITLDDLTLLRKVSYVVRVPGLETRPMPDPVRNMHTKNGLIADNAFGVTLAEAEFELVRVMESVFADHDIAMSPMCGSSVHFDRAFLLRDMPRFEAMFHYRNIDTSTIKELVERWPLFVGDNKRPVPLKLHRVDPDLADSIDEMRYYKALLFDRN